MNLISTKLYFLLVALLISFCRGQLLENFSASFKSIQLLQYFEDNLNSGEVTLDALQTIFKALKSSSFPTAFANLTNEKCVKDSQLYVRNLYNSGSNSSWARQSKTISKHILKNFLSLLFQIILQLGHAVINY